jgi:BioD-like phosphotransacetylase family protein
MIDEFEQIAACCHVVENRLNKFKCGEGNAEEVVINDMKMAMANKIIKLAQKFLEKQGYYDKDGGAVLGVEL